MSKNKKRVIAIVLVCVLVIIVGFLIKCYQDKKQEKHHQQFMRETVQELERIHNNSYLLGYKILDLPPEDFKSPYGNDIYIGQKRVGYYNCWEFGDGTYITTIELKSTDGNVFGIKVGDTYEQFSKTMEEEGYVLSKVGDSVFSDRIKYLFKKAYIGIGTEVSTGNKIESIWVAIDDPTIPLRLVD